MQFKLQKAVITSKTDERSQFSPPTAAIDGGKVYSRRHSRRHGPSHLH